MQELRAANEQVKRLMREMADRESESAHRTSEREAMFTAEIKKLQEELLARQRDIEFFDNKIKELEAKLARAEQNEKQLNHRLGENQVAYNALLDKLAKLEDKLTHQRQEILRLTRERNEMEDIANKKTFKAKIQARNELTTLSPPSNPELLSAA